jgi:hypothetical protein
MPAADTYELTIDQARDWQWTIWWKVGRTPRTAVPKEGLADYDIFLAFKEEYEDTVPLVLLSVGDGIDIGLDGSIQFWMTNDVCETLPAKRLKFEVVAISPDNYKTALAKGTAIIVPKVV